MKEFRKRYWYEIALCTTFFSLIDSPIAYTADIEENLVTVSDRSNINVDKDTYTVNFNNISIIEFVRFASKITNLNFIFDEGDLQFSVTVVSEEAVSAKNVMSALSQVLRMHDLILLEQDGNVLITKNRRVNQIPPIVSSDLPESEAANAALITRVFRIKNANVNTIATIIRPMCSDSALIEVSVETRQLIVTDVTTNVEQIASLLMSLDAPHTPLDVETYVVKNIPPQELIAVTQQILNPFTEGNPLIFVPQNDTNSIFVVSTPYLIERAMTVMEDLDLPAKPVVISRQSMSGKNIFLYKTINRSVGELIKELTQVNQQLKNVGGPQTPLQVAIHGVQPIQDTNSLMFIADPDTTTTLKDILAALDTPSTGKTSFFIYKIQRAQQSQIELSLKLMIDRLQSSSHPDQDLIDAINSMRWIKETNSLVFTGTDPALKKLQEIVPTFDVSPYQARSGDQAQAKSTFLIYNPQHLSGDDLRAEIKEIDKNLKDSGLADPSFLQTLDSMKWVPSTNSLVFTGDPQSIEKLSAVLKSMDILTSTISTSQVFIYKPQYASPDQIQNALNTLVPSLKAINSTADQNLILAIQSLQWNGETQSFMVISDPATIDRLKSLLASIDSPQSPAGVLAKGFYLYKLQNSHCEAVLEQLKTVASKLPTNTIQNQNLINAIDKTECVSANNSLLITGTTDAIEQEKTLIAEFDSAGVKIGAQAFLIYKPKYLPPEEIEAALNDLASDLETSGLNDPTLFQTLKTMRYVPQTNSLLFTGSQEGLDKIQNLINGIDTSTALGAIQRIGNLTFFLYKIQYATPDKLISSLKTFAQELKQSNVQDKQLADSVNAVKWIKETNSLLFTGNSDTLERIEQLVKKFDIPSLGGPAPIERAATTFVIYNPKYLSGDELISILCDFMQNLMTSGVSDPGLFDAINALKWIPKTSSLLISGDQQSVEKVQQLLVKFDIPGKGVSTPSIESIDNTSFLVYKLQYHPGDDIQSALKQVAVSLGKTASTPTALVDAINSLQWVQVTNSLLCSGQQDVLVKLKDLIQNLDVPLRQVFIEVLVIQTSLTNTQNFGLMWGAQAQYFNKATLGTGNFPINQNSQSTGGATTPVAAFAPTLQGINATNTPKGGNVPFFSGFDMGVIGDIIMNKGRSFISLGALVNAIQLDNDSTIVLNPKIITQDNRQSTIFVGQNIPYTGAIVTNTSSNTTSTANIEYRDVGVSLTITPILGDGDVITLDIVNDISQVTNAAQTTSTTQLTGIQTSHTHMETRVHVPNNFFVALSGMINDSKTHYRTAIPCLGGLPVIGALFSENDRTASKGNIIIFIRPQIVKTYAEYKQITEHQEWLYKDNARLPMLKEEFDEGLDIVKLPENE